MTVAFDGTGSTDSDGSIVAYAWDFGDGNSSTLATPSNIYLSDGIYTATLIVTDNNGAKDTTSTPITVNNVNTPPTAVAAATPTTGAEALAVTFDGSGSSDTDGTIASYAWTYGDGGAGTGMSPTYTYNTAGIYAAILTVTDNNGGVHSDTLTITVTTVGGNIPPTAPYFRCPNFWG